MKALLPLLTLLFLSASLVSAQVTPTPSNDWTSVQRCITAPSTPPRGWTFGGVIFTLKPGDGVHAFRADVATPYYVAFDSDSEFGEVGVLSPDGKWFAVPVGYTYGDYTGFQNSWLSNDYVINQIQVYGTTPAHPVYSYPVHYEGMGVSAAAAEIEWVNNQTVFVTGDVDLYGIGRNTDIFDPFTGKSVSIAFPVNTYLLSVSPDNSRWIYISLPAGVNTALNLLPAGQAVASAVKLPIDSGVILWSPDASRFVGYSQDGKQIEIFDRNGQLVDSIQTAQMSGVRSFTGDRLASTGISGTIQIADFATHTITDTCIKTPYGVALSPDGQQLAFGLESAGYVYILDLRAWQAYQIDLAAADVIGWYPVE